VRGLGKRERGEWPGRRERNAEDAGEDAEDAEKEEERGVPL
jgi:hypothetical protein